MSEKLSLEVPAENVSGEGTEMVHLTEQDVVKSVCLLDSWFIRASWLYKRDFLFRCLENINKEGLEQVVLLLGPPTKDYYYSLSGYINNAEDVIPQDDNRQLDKYALDIARDSDYQWLLSLPRQQIANILIGLTELSGNALRMQLYQRALNHLNEIQANQIQATQIKKPKESYGLPEGVNKNSKEYHNYKTQLDKYNDFIDKLKRRIVKTNSSDQKKGVSKKYETKDQDSLDYLQMLPSWIGRQVMSYLDIETLTKCEKVNPYWKYLVKEYRGEMETRIKIDNIITLLKLNDTENTKPLKCKNEKKKNQSKFKLDEDYQKVSQANFMKRKSESQELLQEHRLSSSLHTNKDTVMETIKIFSKSKDRLAFRKQHLLVWTLDEYALNRVLTLGKQWLAFSKGGTIVLCNLNSFANMPGTIKGHDGRITAMAFHPQDGQLVSAGTDSIVRRWEVWSRQEMHNFNFPQVKDILINTNYYVIAGPTLIKVFCWKMNRCQCTVEVEEQSIFNTIAISHDDTIYISYFQESNIKRICAKNGALLMEIHNTNCARITRLRQCGCYFITANEEGLVNLWKLNETETLLLATRNFLRKINDVVLHEGCILAAGDNGKLYIWDISVDEIVQTSIINEDSMPLLNINLLNYYDHCKVIISSEMGIKVLQFVYERKKMKKRGFASPYTCRFLSDTFNTGRSSKVITMRGKTKEKKITEEQMKRQSCHPKLRKDLEKILTIKETIATEFLLREDVGDLRYFPAMYDNDFKSINRFEQPQVKHIKEEDQPEVPNIPKLQTTLKNFLPMLNPYKHRF